MASQSPAQHPQLPLPNYFSQFANVYAKQTGHTTLTILADVITDNVQVSCNAFSQGSIVHDTAAGPAIGAAALIARLCKHELPLEVLVTDNEPKMVTAAEESLDASPLHGHVKCRILDSENLTAVADEYFTHSMNNFSIFAFLHPVEAIRETCRTLKTGGLAIVTCWRRFAPMVIVHAAQKKIRPDLPLMETPSPEFYEDGVLQKVVEQGGFAKENINVVTKELLVTDPENKKGLYTLMSGPFMAKARLGYTKAEEDRWAGAIEQAMAEEEGDFGGIKFEAYVLLATK
ncbi:Methyltransferase type 11 [Moelleriella libera RCEF 2490]|uniref:Methyltransferase type 11 n=1 Tax=Moelleriella libera RCEF 2490 TaxID=1081109 RepID=A0A167VI75_9HYPO|nr:Methyltransferase type 11 [Moelleriella libera RCEF 2490]